jgi:hypothetical protein
MGSWNELHAMERIRKNGLFLTQVNGGPSLNSFHLSVFFDRGTKCKRVERIAGHGTNGMNPEFGILSGSRQKCQIALVHPPGFRGGRVAKADAPINCGKKPGSKIDAKIGRQGGLLSDQAKMPSGASICCAKSSMKNAAGSP